MSMVKFSWAVAFAALLAPLQPAPACAQGQDFRPIVNQGERILEFDWSDIRVGTAEYEEGPTGATVISFGRRALVAMDARGGGPGTVNSDYIGLGYDLAELDAVVFSGGSWYGLETVTAVASAMKDDGYRDGSAFTDPPNIALVTGSIIFDYGPRRLNEIYPDSRLAQAAYRAAQPGRFALGAEGAGRFTISGGFFGCNAYSGQGGAFRQIGELKIAVFTVVNAYGAVVDRQGRIPTCYSGPNWPPGAGITDLMQAYPDSARPGWGENARRQNTTVSLVVINQRMAPAELHRLAVQVHTSMARGIQPFATLYDGDVLYAASTQELDLNESGLSSVEISVIASELMWDAILSAAPQQPVAPEPAQAPVLSAARTARLAGTYSFSPEASLRVTTNGLRVFAQAVGERNVYAIGREAATELLPVSQSDFVIPGRYPLVLRFERSGRLVINPGHWEQTGRRV